MKFQIGTKIPDNFTKSWPGQYEIFSHYEFSCGIPQLMFAVTTYKENGLANIALHAWSCFQGDKGGYYAILGGMGQYTHTYENIKRTGEFGINFLNQEYYDRLIKTIENNKEDMDEFEVGGFNVKKASIINAPLIEESFLAMECTLHSIMDLSGSGIMSTVIGKVVNTFIEEEYAKGLDNKYTSEGFMFNIDAPKIIATGEDGKTGIASLKVDRVL